MVVFRVRWTSGFSMIVLANDQEQARSLAIAENEKRQEDRRFGEIDKMELFYDEPHVISVGFM